LRSKWREEYSYPRGSSESDDVEQTADIREELASAVREDKVLIGRTVKEEKSEKEVKRGAEKCLNKT
jgi:Ribonuclease G/E